MDVDRTSEFLPAATVLARLQRFCRQPQGGFARVDYEFEQQRRSLTDQLRASLDLPFAELELPTGLTSVQLVDRILEFFDAHPQGVVSLHNFTAALPLDTRELMESLYAFNFRRERLARPGLRQIWWLPTWFGTQFTRTVPDLDSWFLIRLQLEPVKPLSNASELLQQSNDRDPALLMRVEDAKKYAKQQLETLRHSLDSPTPNAELRDRYVVPALRVLRTNGLDADADQLNAEVTALLADRKVPDLDVLRPAPALHAQVRQLLAQSNRLIDSGDYRYAEATARRALDILEQHLPDDAEDLSWACDRLATALQHRGNYQEAEPLFRRALQIRERIFGSEHPKTLPSLNNLAGLLYDKGDYATAEPLFRRTLEAVERIFGPEHPNTLINLHNLARLLQEKGDLSAAEPLYLRALNTQERVLGREHPDTLSSLHHLAQLLRAKGDDNDAEPLYRRALETAERVRGPEHPDTLISLNNLASLLGDKGDLAGAEPLLRRALEGAERTLGLQHRNTRVIRENLESLLLKKPERGPKV